MDRPTREFCDAIIFAEVAISVFPFGSPWLHNQAKCLIGGLGLPVIVLGCYVPGNCRKTVFFAHFFKPTVVLAIKTQE